MKKTLLTIITITLLLSLTLLTAFATGETTAAETTVRMNEFGKVIEIPTPVVFAISGGITLIAAIVIFRKRRR